MKKLAKYLKPFALGVILSIGLLLVQAVCDLNLPNYMSRIVNIGIQQNGIQSGAPEAISRDGLEFMTGLMTEEQAELVSVSYSLRNSDDKNKSGKLYKDIYPNAAELYVRNDGLPQDIVNELEASFGTAAWTMINLMKSLTQGEANSPMQMNTQEIDVTRMYQLQPMLSQLPQGAFDSARSEALSLGGSTLAQTAAIMTAGFYKELGINIASYQSGYIIRVGIIMLLIALGSGVATIFVSLLSSRIAAGVARNLRNDVFQKVEKFSNAEYDKFSTASLITRSTNDVMQIQMLLMMGIRMMCYAPIMGVGGIVMALNKSVSMSWIIAVAVIALVGLIAIVFSIVTPRFKTMQKLIDRLNLVARETLNGLMVIRAFGTSKFEKERFDGANTDLAKTNLFINRVMTFMMPIMMLIMNGVTLLIIWVGAHHVAQAQMQVGDMMAFMQYAMQIIMSFFMISMMFIFIPRAAVSGQRIAEVLEIQPSILDPEKPKSIGKGSKGRVEFKNVSFRYTGAEEDALSDISFVAQPGETTAFIGATGSGKSTLINLIPRFYDATVGEILVDGVNVKELTQKELRSHIGYVPQKSVLMSGTIESNIKYGNDNATTEELNTAAAVAQALDFIKGKEDGFESEISQGGTNVSGGQRQRLSIARALAVKPDIYIFDDSFSALDFKTDAALRKALKAHTGESTVLIVAQRVSTIMDANQIYVIDDGRIVGHGTHKELLKTCPEYYEIASSQLSKEELDNE